MRNPLLFLLLLVALAFHTQSAHAAKRVALVIGNSNYTLISPLTNPKNDAELMARTLEGAGFEVIKALDVNYRDMRVAVRDFGKALRRGGKDAVGLLYFAGHGVQAGGENYLIPIGAQIEDTADLNIEALSASDILSQMESAGNRLNLVILDACRNNPFKGRARSVSRGLAKIEAATGSLIAFAAAPGQVALDGDGRNSPYTEALAAAIKQPGLAVEQVFKRVRIAVQQVTSGRQTPWEQSSLLGDFYFNTTKAPIGTPQGDAAEISFWNTIRDKNDAALFEAYIEQYPNGSFVPLARALIRRLKNKQQASVDPGDNADEDLSDREVRRRIQQILTDAGCRPGRVDGVWSRDASRALLRYARRAQLELPDDLVSPETLALLTTRSGRVCPLECAAGTVERNGKCVPAACPPGQVKTVTGHCKQRPTGEFVDRFVGDWLNVNAKTDGITRVEIKSRQGKLHLQMWGQCHPTDCDWGTQATPNADSDDGELKIKWDHGFSTKTQSVVLLADGRLRVSGRTHFTDSSGRPDYDFTYFFKKK